MRSKPIEQIEKDGFVAKILYDEEPVSPKDWDQLGTLVTWSRRHCFDEDGQKRFGEPADFLEEAAEGGWTYLPVAMLDHSGIHLWVGKGPHSSDSAGWDSGQVGYIYTTKERIEKLGVPEDGVLACLAGEVGTWDQYVSGDVYGIVVDGPDGEQRESCWGFYGFEYAKQEAAEMLDNVIRYEGREAAKIDRMMAL